MPLLLGALSTVALEQHRAVILRQQTSSTRAAMEAATASLASLPGSAVRGFSWRQTKMTRTRPAMAWSKPTVRLVAAAGCKTCSGKGAVDCEGCKGTGKNKKNGNMFERWKCYDCQGFGMRKCPSCGKKGLTPEQRGER